jgi:hypothetical protein
LLDCFFFPFGGLRLCCLGRLGESLAGAYEYSAVSAGLLRDGGGARWEVVEFFVFEICVLALRWLTAAPARPSGSCRVRQWPLGACGCAQWLLVEFAQTSQCDALAAHLALQYSVWMTLGR